MFQRQLQIHRRLSTNLHRIKRTQLYCLHWGQHGFLIPLFWLFANEMTLRNVFRYVPLGVLFLRGLWYLAMDILWDRGHKDILLSRLENSNIDCIQGKLPNHDRLLDCNWQLNTLQQSYYTLDFQVVAHIIWIRLQFQPLPSLVCCFKRKDSENG